MSFQCSDVESESNRQKDVILPPAKKSETTINEEIMDENANEKSNSDEPAGIVDASISNEKIDHNEGNLILQHDYEDSSIAATRPMYQYLSTSSINAFENTVQSDQLQIAVLQPVSTLIGEKVYHRSEY